MKIKDAQYYLAAIRDKKYSDAEKEYKLYEYFNGEKKAKKATLAQIKKHTAALNVIFADGELPQFNRIIKINKVKYGLDPSIKDMEGGAFFDLDKLVQDNIELNLHKIIAILYRPITIKIGSRYEVKSYVDESTAELEEREKIFLHEFNYHEALGVVDFFWSSTLNYSKS